MKQNDEHQREDDFDEQQATIQKIIEANKTLRKASQMESIRLYRLLTKL